MRICRRGTILQVKQSEACAELKKCSVARLLLFVVLTIYLASHFDVFTFSASSLIHCDDTLQPSTKPFGSPLINTWTRNRKMRLHQGIRLDIALLHIAISGNL